MKRAYLIIPALLLASLLASCSKQSAPTVDPTGKMFPKVEARNLNEQPLTLPDALFGRPAVVLVGYQQKAQFDIDRWILGLLQADVPVQIVEVPTIAGMMPQMVQSFIDNGMRSGIPEEDWASVVTVYEDSAKIIEAIGNERPQSAHVNLLDAGGRIVWSSNRGYSAQQVLELKKIAERLAKP